MPKLKPTTDPVERFNRKAFSEVDTPEERQPKMPGKVSSLTNVQIGDLMAKYAAWREYAEDEHSRELSRLMLMQEEYDSAYDTALIQFSIERLTETATLRKSRVRDMLKGKRMELVTQQSYVDLLANKIESFNNCIAVISREIARRGQEPPGVSSR